MDKLTYKENSRLLELLQNLETTEPQMMKLLLGHLQQGDRELYTMKREATHEHNSGMHDPTRLVAKQEKNLFLKKEVRKIKKLDLLI